MIYILKWTKDSKIYQYVLSSEDILNLLRAVSREGKPQDAVTWTLLNRFAYIYPEYNTFSKFVKAYAQPINPRWFPTGDLYLSNVKSGRDNARQRKLAENRVSYAKTPSRKIPKTIKDVVYGVLNGLIKNPVIGAQHFMYSMASSKNSEEQARKKQQNYIKKYPYLTKPIFTNSSLRKNNWFFASNGSDNFNISIISKNEYGIGLTYLSIGLLLKKSLDYI